MAVTVLKKGTLALAGFSTDVTFSNGGLAFKRNRLDHSAQYSKTSPGCPFTEQSMARPALNSGRARAHSLSEQS